MKLIIAEKPELAKAIAIAIPGERKNYTNRIEINEYVICWVAGHILRFKEPQEINEKYKFWNLEDLPIFFNNWEKTYIKEKKQLLDNISFLLKKADEVIHAGDPDDEGQYLIDEVLEYLNNKKPVKRILINNNNVEAIKKAFNKIEDNEKYITLGKAAEARAISDMIVGYNLSRLYSILNDTTLSVGRVQTPTLSLVVNRDLEIENHKKIKYYELLILQNSSEEKIKFKLQHDKDIDKTIKENFINITEKVKNKEGTLKIRKRIILRSPPFPFNLVKLQNEANKLYGYSAEEVLKISQSLRDKHKAITYNRSDCEYLSQEHFKEAVELIPYIVNKLEFNIEKSSLDFSEENKSKCFDDKSITAHHAIIPTFSGEFDEFDEKEKNIYLLIAKKYIIQFLAKEKVEKTEGIIEIDNFIFKSNSIKILEPGYTNFYKNLSEEDNVEENSGLSKLSEGDYEVFIDEEDINIIEKETSPKKPYTEGNLLLDMTSISKYVKNEKIKELLKKKDEGKKGANGSIGTPATQASIIKGLIDKGFIERYGTGKNQKLKSTQLARKFLSILPASLKNPDLTAFWWEIQEKIKEGTVEKEYLINIVLRYVSDIIKLQNKEENFLNEDFLKCPECSSKIKQNKNVFYCSNENCNFKIFKKMKLTEKTEFLLNNEILKELLERKEILIKNIISKSDKKYDAYYKILKDEKYYRIEFSRFPSKKRRKNNKI